MSATAALAIAAVVLLAAAAAILPLFTLWVQARFSGAPIDLFSLVGMRLRGVDPRIIVFSHIRSVKAGVGLTPRMLEVHSFAGGRVQNVVTAMIAARKAAIPLSWETATEIDLAGRDIVEAVHWSVNPRAVACGKGNPPIIEAQAGDGTLLRLTVEFICKPEFNRLIDGVPLETLRRRICEAAGEFVNAAPDADPLIADPGLIERHLLSSRLDQGAALTVTGYRVKASRTHR